MSEWIAESVVQALRLLPDDLVADYAYRAGGVDELAKRMRACADGVVASLDGRITVEERVLVAAATLTTGGTGAGVYTETRAAVKRFTKLRERRRSCPGLDLALLLRAPADFDGAALARLAVTAQAKPLLVEQPVEPWRLIIAAAALSKSYSDPKSLADAAVDTVRKAGTLTARYIAEHPDSRLEKPVFDQPGDAMFAINTVAMRLVLDGRLDAEPTHIADLLAQLATKSRANFTKPAAHGQDVDGVAVLYAHAAFLGDTTTDKIFRQVYATGLAVRRRPSRELSGLNRAGDWREPADEPAGSDQDRVHRLVSWTMVELFAGTDAADRTRLRRWITDAAKPNADELLFLLDRLHPLVVRFRDLPQRLPADDLPDDADTAAVRDELRTRFSAGVQNGLPPVENLVKALPPLWVKRETAIKAVASKLCAPQGRRGTRARDARLVAAVLVHAPRQGFQPGNVNGRTTSCGCGAKTRNGQGRAVAAPDAVCPHRHWEQAGLVEDYATLAQLDEDRTPDSVRKALERYAGPLADWVAAAFVK